MVHPNFQETRFFLVDIPENKVLEGSRFYLENHKVEIISAFHFEQLHDEFWL